MTSPSSSSSSSSSSTPPPASPLATAEPWDLVADGYTAEALPHFEVYARAALAAAALPRGAHIVDVAAGPGTLGLLAAADGARVASIDFSEEMTARFRARAQAMGLADSCDIRVGDGQKLPFSSGAFDAAFSLFGLMFFPDRQAGFRELRRVLQPGAPAVVSSWIPFVGPFGALMQVVKELIPGLPLGGGKPPLSDPEDFRREMSEAGFPSVTVETVAHELTAPSFDAFWDSMERTNAPLVLVRHRVGALRWAELAPRIRERVRAALGEGPLVIGRGAYLGIGRA